MEGRTRKLWEKQRTAVGDRVPLFSAVADAAPKVATVLYPGSYVDLTPSLVWNSVTYLDNDRRADRFFNDRAGIEQLLTEHDVDAGKHQFQFIHGDYTDVHELQDESFDLLISLYAGVISKHCTRFLRIGGCLLVNPSHGDVAMASINAKYRLRAVVIETDASFSVSEVELDRYLVPKRDVEVTAELIEETGRGITYTTAPFAYLFERIA